MGGAPTNQNGTIGFDPQPNEGARVAQASFGRGCEKPLWLIPFWGLGAPPFFRLFQWGLGCSLGVRVFVPWPFSLWNHLPRRQFGKKFSSHCQLIGEIDSN